MNTTIYMLHFTGNQLCRKSTCGPAVTGMMADPRALPMLDVLARYSLSIIRYVSTSRNMLAKDKANVAGKTKKVIFILK